MFAIWEQEGVFAQVKLTAHGQIEWPGEVDLCPDALYLRGRLLPARMPEGSRFYGIVIKDLP